MPTATESEVYEVLREAKQIAHCYYALTGRPLGGLPSLRRKAREGVAEVGTVERSVFVDLSPEEALPQRAIWNEADSEFLEGRQHFRFRASRPQRGAG